MAKPRGDVHAMEEEMRANKEGVFAPASDLRAAAPKAAPASPETKMEAAPENKAAAAKPIDATAITAPQRPKARRARK